MGEYICAICGAKIIRRNKVFLCSKQCKKEFLRNKNFDIFVKENNLHFKIKELIEEKNHSAGMIFDWLIRDHQMKNIRLELVRNYCYSQFKYDNSVYNKQPQWFKLQYRYPKNISIEDIKKDLSQKSKNGQILTVISRKENGSYKNQPFSKNWSPLCKEFYQKKGLTDEEAELEMKKIQTAGALACLKKTQKPLSEARVKKFLQSLNLSIVSQFSVALSKEERKFRKRMYIYDFYIPKFNLVIDVHGLYWHASPQLFKNNDILHFPGGNVVLAKDVWEADEHREKIAHNRNHKYVVLWEDETKLENLIYEKLRIYFN